MGPCSLPGWAGVYLGALGPGAAVGGGWRDRHKKQRSETRQKGWAGKVSDKLSSSREKSRHKQRGVCARTRARREAQRVSRGAAGIPQGGQEVQGLSGVRVYGPSGWRKWYGSCVQSLSKEKLPRNMSVQPNTGMYVSNKDDGHLW